MCGRGRPLRVRGRSGRRQPPQDLLSEICARDIRARDRLFLSLRSADRVGIATPTKTAICTFLYISCKCPLSSLLLTSHYKTFLPPRHQLFSIRECGNECDFSAVLRMMTMVKVSKTVMFLCAFLFFSVPSVRLLPFRVIRPQNALCKTAPRDDDAIKEGRMDRQRSSARHSAAGLRATANFVFKR